MTGSDNAVLTIARAMARHATEAQAVAARNIAHADTPGYKAQEAEEFAKAFAAGRASPIVSVDRHAEVKANGNSVSLEEQVMALTEARGQHDMAMALWGQTLSLFRTALGRAR